MHTHESCIALDCANTAGAFHVSVPLDRDPTLSNEQSEICASGLDSEGNDES